MALTGLDLKQIPPSGLQLGWVGAMEEGLVWNNLDHKTLVSHTCGGTKKDKTGVSSSCVLVVWASQRGAPRRRLNYVGARYR